MNKVLSWQVSFTNLYLSDPPVGVRTTDVIMTKPVAAYIAGVTAPPGKRMGHAGAIIRAFGESAAEKVEIMREAGITVASSPAELGSTAAKVLGSKPKRVAVAT